MRTDQASTNVRQALFVAVPGSTFWDTEEYRDYAAQELPAFEQSYAMPDISYADMLAARMAKEKAHGEQMKVRQKLARTVECPNCGVPVGSYCRAKTGRISGEPHKVRVRAAKLMHEHVIKADG